MIPARFKPACSTLAAAVSATALLVGASAAAAQDYAPYGNGRYDGFYEYDEPPIPPRPVPEARYGYRPAGTVVTTTRRVVTADDGYDAPTRTVVTTRRVVSAPVEPAPDSLDEDFGFAPPRRISKSEPPLAVLPPRRIVRETFAAPPPPVERVVTTRRVLPPAAPGPVVIEERRVETTRRIIRPAPADWEE